MKEIVCRWYVKYYFDIERELFIFEIEEGKGKALVALAPISAVQMADQIQKDYHNWALRRFKKLNIEEKNAGMSSDDVGWYDGKPI